MPDNQLRRNRERGIVAEHTHFMQITLENKDISPVHVESRQALKISAGDTIRVWQKIVEDKGKVRLQAFGGIVIATKHNLEPGATFTVRRVGTDGIGVEKIFPLYSPMIDKIEINKRSKVRRAKLYFLRDKTPKQIRHKLRRSETVTESSVSEIEEKKKMQKKESTHDDVTPTIEPAQQSNEKGEVEVQATPTTESVQQEEVHEHANKEGEEQKETTPPEKTNNTSEK